MARYLTRLPFSLPGREHLNAEYDAIVKLTGEMALAWARLDERLSEALSYLLGTDLQVAKIVYYTPSAFSGRLEMVLNLTRHCMPDCEEKETFLRVLQKVDKLHKTRNSITHSNVNLIIAPVGKDSILERSEVRPSTKAFERRFKAKAHDIEHHLELVEYTLQYLAFFVPVVTAPFGKRAVEHWATMLLNTASAASS